MNGHPEQETPWKSSEDDDQHIANISPDSGYDISPRDGRHRNYSDASCGECDTAEEATNTSTSLGHGQLREHYDSQGRILLHVPYLQGLRIWSIFYRIRILETPIFKPDPDPTYNEIINQIS